MKRLAFGLVALFAMTTMAAPAQLRAQISSDRPGIGSGSAIVPHKAIQAEVGFAYYGSITNDTYQIGQALVRVGAPGFEVEFFANSYTITRTDYQDGPIEGEGFEDLGVGFKVPLVEAAGFALSFQGILGLPVGSDIWTADEWVTTGNLLADIALAGPLSVAVNAGYQAVPNAVDDVVSIIVTPGVALGGGFGVYGGWAGFFADGPDRHFAEAGLTFLPTPDVQLDVNWGAVDGDSDWFLGFGVAVRR